MYKERERERENFLETMFSKRKKRKFRFSKKFLLLRERERVEIFITFGITYIVLQCHRLQIWIDRERERERNDEERASKFFVKKKTYDGSGLTLSCFDFFDADDLYDRMIICIFGIIMNSSDGILCDQICHTFSTLSLSLQNLTDSEIQISCVFRA